MICLSPDSISFVHFIAGFGKAATEPTRKTPAKHLKLKKRQKQNNENGFAMPFLLLYNYQVFIVRTYSLNSFFFPI